MCRGGRFLAEFMAGTERRPEVPEAVESCLTLTNDDVWLVGAQKLAPPYENKFLPLPGGAPYPADAIAQCRRGRRHAAPQRDCTCGFHAVSSSLLLPFSGVPYKLD